MRLPPLVSQSIVAILGLTSCTLGPSNLSDSGTITAALESGRNIYNFRCYFCHGYSGDAQTVAASFLSPPPVDFTKADAARLTPEYIVSVLQKGKPGTAMKSFLGIISEQEMNNVALFVADEFIRHKAPNTRYHTPENGWPNHERYRDAFPFATGEIPSDAPWEGLSESQVQGRRLFVTSCIICHDRGDKGRAEIIWEARPLSYPRNNYSHTSPATIDAMASASPYRLHDIPPKLLDATPLEKQGEKIFQENCAFCHGADGTGKNWIGSFLESHPRNLQDPKFMATMTRTRLAATIRDGLPNTSMPAWKNVLSSEEITAVVAYISKVFYSIPE